MSLGLKHKKAFTLVELLVAIAIFSVLSALGWQVFDYLIKVKQRNTEHELRLGQLQESYQQILRDTIQAVPLTANIKNDIQPALVLQNGRFNFSKTVSLIHYNKEFHPMNVLNINIAPMRKNFIV